MHEKFDGTLLACFGRVDLDRFGIDGLGVDIHADAGLQDVDDHEPNDEGQRRHHLEIDQCLEADASNLLHILHAGNAMHDRAENDWSNQHFDQLNETVTERFHLFSQLRIEVTQQDAENDRGQHLSIKMRIERLARCSRRGRCARLHDVLPYGLRC